MPAEASRIGKWTRHVVLIVSRKVMLNDVKQAVGPRPLPIAPRFNRYASNSGTLIVTRTTSLRIHFERLPPEPGSWRYDLYLRLGEILEPHGLRPSIHPATRWEVLRSAVQPGYSLILMAEPKGARMLTFRRGYMPGTWRFERTNQRGDWTVAGMTFDPDWTDRDEARAWVGRQRKRLRLDRAPLERAPYILVPLQGKLFEKRRFQTKSPIDMIRDAVRFAQGRDILLTLHPREIYSEAERSAIDNLARDPKVHLVEHDMNSLLASADFVVTQNSSVAFWGLFHETPSILYAECDFHHINIMIENTAADRAFAEVGSTSPDFATYLYWFCHHAHLDLSLPRAPHRLVSRLRALGWAI